MPKLPKKKTFVYDLDKLTDNEQKSIQLAEKYFAENAEQFSTLAKSIADVANSNLVKLIGSISIPNLTLPSIVEKLEPPELPDTSWLKDIDYTYLEPHHPPVSIKKTDWEIEKESREAYMVDLQIQVLEQQLNIQKGFIAPQYDINSGIISFKGKEISIPLNSNQEMVCRVVLRNSVNMKKRWSWDEVVEACREEPNNFSARKIYTATRSINDKVAIETQTKDFLLAKPFTTVRLNPSFLPK